MEIWAGKVLMQDTKHQKALGTTTAGVVHGIEMTCHYLQRVQPAMGNATQDKYYGDSWFALVKAAEECYVHCVNCIGPAKPATQLFPMAHVQAIMEKLPAGTTIVLEGTGPKETPLLAIGYKYNSHKYVSPFLQLVTQVLQKVGSHTSQSSIANSTMSSFKRWNDRLFSWSIFRFVMGLMSTIRADKLV